MSSRFFAALSLIFVLAAPPNYAQTDPSRDQLLQDIYQKDVDLIRERRSLQVHRAGRNDPSSHARREYEKAQRYLASGEDLIDKTFAQLVGQGPQDGVTAYRSEYRGAFRTNIRSVPIRDLSRIAGRRIMVDSIGVEVNLIKLQNLLPSQEQFDREYINAELVCDQDYRVRTDGKFREKKAGEITSFRLEKGASNGITLSTPPAGETCSVRLENRLGERAEFSFINEDKLLSDDLRSLSRSFEVCGLPEYVGPDTTKRFFLTAQLGSFSCPQPMDSYKTLEDPIDAFQEKARALSGADLPKEMIDRRDPYFPLDLSSAPTLDAIYISYLVFRMDFYGAVIERLIRHHAARGTQIKIVVADVVTLDKDRQALDGLQLDFPGNVSVKYSRVGGGAIASLADWVNQFHRSIHMKKFITYSKNEPAASVAVIGGRNIHDGFVFKTPSNLASFPGLVQYGKGARADESFSRWTDFELAISDPAVIRTLIAQFHTIFDNDNEDVLFRNYSVNRKNGSEVGDEFFLADKPIVRHLVSVPYRDGRILEQYAAGLIDAAQTEIVISTPYFNLTRKLETSLANALKRGVRIKLITRIDLKGDTAAWALLEAVNKRAINKFYKQFEIYEFTSPDDILHSKIILVDGKLSSIGSMNLNQRSFKHDIENVMLVYSPEFNRQMTAIVDGYMKTTRRVDDRVKEKAIPKLIVRVFRSVL